MYDLKAIKAIPCAEIARKHGLDLKEKHGRLWGKLRQEEKTASFSINTKNNLWYDFGAGKGGSVIDLLAELEGISPTEAINRLAQDYGFVQEEIKGWRPLTDSQYRELGIQPERATMNFAFDLNKHSIKQLTRWSEKYGMPVKELAVEYPIIYNKMIFKRAMEEINFLKDGYYERLKNFLDPAISKDDKEFIKAMSKIEAEKIDRKIELLQRALTSSKGDFDKLRVNFKEDFKEEKKQIATKGLLEDERIKEKIIKVYKDLYGFGQIKNFTVEQAKALRDINLFITKANNKFLPIEGIKKAYEELGQKLDKLGNDYSNLMKEKENIDHANWEKQVSDIKNEMEKYKIMFNKCDIVMNGIKEIVLQQKNGLAKENMAEKKLEKNVEQYL